MARRRTGRLRRLVSEVARRYPDIADPETLILAGDVLVDGRAIANPASLVRADVAITLRRPSTLRGEIKLRTALSAFRVVVSGRVALDVGAATGGFTKALLDAGATRVYAVDAGFGQLLGSLRQDPRVVDLERTNLGALGTALIQDVIEVVTIDLSYLAIARAAPQLDRRRLAPRADLIALVKPMFELALAAPPAGRDLIAAAVERAKDGLERSGWRPVADLESPITGTGGAVEHLVHAQKAQARRRRW